MKRNSLNTNNHDIVAPRLKQAQLLEEYERRIANNESERFIANDIEVPRSNLRHWEYRKNNIPMPKKIVELLESPDGQTFLHIILTAIHYVFVETGGCGIRLITSFLKFSKLHNFIGPSYESQRQYTKKMEEKTIEFGAKQDEKLGKLMPKKKITMANDETHHPTPCLVGMDVISNFILIEKYSEKKDADAWNKSFDTAVKNFNVDVFQVTSDQGSGIVKHVEQHLQAHQSPDLFHIQNDITKGISGRLSTLIQSAQRSYDKAFEALNKYKEKNKQGEVKLKKLNDRLNQAKKNLDKCLSDAHKVKQAKQQIGHSYHPYDIYTGEANSSDKLKTELTNQFDQVDAIAKEINLKELGKNKLKKARKMVSSMVKTFDFYWNMVSMMITSFMLTTGISKIFQKILIPIQYLTLAKRKAKNAKSKKKIDYAISKLEEQLNNDISWYTQTKDQQADLFSKALQCANIFQRSSSCVEGRNGHLSLRHHGLHNISDRKLRVLTIIHNYQIRRADETTAAERFFEQKHDDLFEYLVKNMPYPPRPGKLKKEVLKMSA